MQYIKKTNTPPPGWDAWFTTATDKRSFDYGRDYPALTELKKAKEHLIAEQHGLCAYCQKTISQETASLEHVLPKSLNLENSTNYHNLVAVCKTQQNDPETGKPHCDKARGDSPINPLIFLSDLDAAAPAGTRYFEAHADGSITANHGLPNDLKKQVEAFVDILNLNHSLLKKNRQEVLDGILEALHSIPQHQKRRFLQSKFDRIADNKRHPYRQFLLLYIGKKLGLN